MERFDELKRRLMEAKSSEGLMDLLEDFLGLLSQNVSIDLPSSPENLKSPKGADEIVAEMQKRFSELLTALREDAFAVQFGAESMLLEKIAELLTSFEDLKTAPLFIPREVLDKVGERIDELSGEDSEEEDKSSDAEHLDPEVLAPVRGLLMRAKGALDQVEETLAKSRPSKRKITVELEGDLDDIVPLMEEFVRHLVQRGQERQRELAEQRGWLEGQTECCKEDGFNPPAGHNEHSVHLARGEPDLSELPSELRMMVQMLRLSGRGGMMIGVMDPSEFFEKS